MNWVYWGKILEFHLCFHDMIEVSRTFIYSPGVKHRTQFCHLQNKNSKNALCQFWVSSKVLFKVHNVNATYFTTFWIRFYRKSYDYFLVWCSTLWFLIMERSRINDQGGKNINKPLEISINRALINDQLFNKSFSFIK